MKREFITAITVIGLLEPAVAFVGWSEDIRLTNRGFEIHPQVIARNDTVHVAWQQTGGDHHISYNQSRDGGAHWEGVWDLEEGGHWGVNIDLSISGNSVFVGWADENTNLPNWVENIAYSCSSDGGIWALPRYVHADTMRNHPSYDDGIISHLDTIYVVYFSDERDSTGFVQFKFLFSSDLGETWSGERTVAHGYNYTNPLQIAKCGGTLYIIWSGDCPPNIFNREVMGAISHDGGQTWTEPFLISSEDRYVAQHSCVACDEETGYFVVAWMDYALSHGFPGDVFVRLTTDGGLTWGDIRHATAHHHASDPSIAIKGDSIYAVWCDRDTAYGYPNSEICFSRSADLGETWSPPYRLTYAEGYSYTPWISYDLGKLHVVWWEDMRPPHYGDEVYYKRCDPEPTGIDDHEEIPDRTDLSAYPNPFNSSTIITYYNAKGGEIGIFDIKGQLVRTFFTGGENEGRIKWDATDASGKTVSSGIYFARAEASQSSNTIKLIYLK